MKWTIFSLLTLCLPFTASASEKFTLDPNHTAVLWHANHFGFSNPNGKWYANGTIEFDKDKLENSKVDVNIKMNELVTGLPEWDKHLKGKQFFDIEQYPTATFVSKKIEVNGGKVTKVDGDLTVHGVTKPVSLDVTLNKIATNPITENETIGFSAKTKVKRSDFNMKTLIPGIGDEISLEIEGEAYQDKKK